MEAAPLIAPRRVPGPDRLWPEEAWEAIRAGCVPRDQEDRWWAFVKDDVLHLHRSGTGFEVYRARFVRDGSGGVSVPEFEVETELSRYQPEDDTEEARSLVDLVDLLAAGALAGDGPTFSLVLPDTDDPPDGEKSRRR